MEWLQKLKTGWVMGGFSTSRPLKIRKEKTKTKETNKEKRY